MGQLHLKALDGVQKMNALGKVGAYLNKPVMEVVEDVKAAALVVVATVASAGTALVSPDASAQTTSAYITSAQTGINQARDDALTVGGYVIAAIAVIIAIGWILSMVKKK